MDNIRDFLTSTRGHQKAFFFVVSSFRRRRCVGPCEGRRCSGTHSACLSPLFLQTFYQEVKNMHESVLSYLVLRVAAIPNG